MLKTEMRNKASSNIDRMDSLSMIELMNSENYNALKAIDRVLPDIAKVCDAVTYCLKKGGRLFYVGAGTSGRIGVLDASECPPTFGVSHDTVIGVIAGGEKCLTKAAESQEDNAQAGETDLMNHNLSDCDIVIGISASGGASYVIGALDYANSVGAMTVSITNNYETPMEKIAKLSIVADTGPEVITGSTRLKAGTAQKLILNMISTASMVQTGKVYENLMINLKPTNIKLRARMIRIVSEIKNCDENIAEKLLEENNWIIREAVK